MKTPKQQLGTCLPLGRAMADPFEAKGIVGFAQSAKPAAFKKVRQKMIRQENPEAHGICIGSTGSGKGTASAIVHALTYPGAMVIVDIKGEIFETTHRHRESLGPVVRLDLSSTGETSDSLNPIDGVKLASKSPEEAALLATQLLHPDQPTGSTNEREPFWANNSDDVSSSILNAIMCVECVENHHFIRLYDWLKDDDVSYKLAVLLDTTKDLPEMAKKGIAAFLQMPDVTRGGVLATAQQHLRLFGDPGVQRALKTTSFDLRAFQRGEVMTIYIIVPPHKLTSHNLLFRTWFSTLLSVAMTREYKPETPTLFLLDEVAALGQMDELRTAFTLLRGYGVKVFIYLQCLSQLKRLYPADWETFVNNAGTIQAFGVTNNLMARQLSEVFGTKTPENFLTMGPDEQMILHHGGRVDHCLKLNYLNDRMFKGLFDANRRYSTERSWVERQNSVRHVRSDCEFRPI